MFLTAAANLDATNYANNLNSFIHNISLITRNPIYMFILWLIPIVAYWYLFEKKGEKGWKVLIPIYGLYIKFKLFFNTRAFWGQLIATIVLSLSFSASFIFGVMLLGPWRVISFNFNVAVQSSPTVAMALLISFVLLIVSFIWILVVSIQYDISICKKYGRGFWFIMGMIFLEPIFIFALAYEVYKGRVSEVNDVEDAFNNEDGNVE